MKSQVFLKIKHSRASSFIPSHCENILTIESRSCSTKRNSRFLKPTYGINEKEIPLRKQSSLSPEKIGQLMTSLSKAEQFLKESRNFAKFRSLKKKIGLAEEPKKIFSKSILSKKTLGKRLQNPMRIPRAGFNIDCLYKYGL